MSFKDKTNIFFGDNGSGKTNILESISLLGKGRGIRNSQIFNLIQHNKENFLINSSLEIKKNNYDINVLSKKNNNKLYKQTLVNNDSSSENLNFLNSSISFLIFLPEMERLFQSSPSYRRNFIDRLIYSYNNSYNKIINKYKKKIQERSRILQLKTFDTSWINVVETEISQIGLEIYSLRALQIKVLNEYLNIINKNNDYKFNISFKLDDSFYSHNLNQEIYLSSLLKSREIDMKIGGSKIGPHKSDFYVNIDSQYNASQLSTGQQKTVVLMTLLAQCYYLVNNKNIKPIILFDEICSHLDSNNRKLLLDMIDSFDIQFFLTGTEKTLFSFISTNVQYYNIV